MKTSKTDFGYQRVNVNEKEHLVSQVFDSIVSKYDLMNDLMSAGIHRIWKKIAVSHCGLQSGHKVLDLAGGTGDLSKEFINLVGDNGQVILADINLNMIKEGQRKLINKGIIKSIYYLQINAENLPLSDNSLDCIALGFGLRNFTNKIAALNEIYRVLKPGGRLVILEFSKPIYNFLIYLYNIYSFNILPIIGKIIANDYNSYKYLIESIRLHPGQELLKNMLNDIGFENCSYQNLSGGICAIHKGFKF